MGFTYHDKKSPAPRTRKKTISPDAIAPGWYVVKMKDRNEKEIVQISLSPYTKRLCLYCVGDTESRSIDSVESWEKYVEL